MNIIFTSDTYSHFPLFIGARDEIQTVSNWRQSQRFLLYTVLPPYHLHPLVNAVWGWNKKAESTAVSNLIWEHAHQVIQFF